MIAPSALNLSRSPLAVFLFSVPVRFRSRRRFRPLPFAPPSSHGRGWGYTQQWQIGAGDTDPGVACQQRTRIFAQERQQGRRFPLRFC
jgi:hypothetical protein